MQRHLDEEQKELHKEILRMAALAQEAIFKSIEALKSKEIVMAEQVIVADTKIDELELLIDERCIDLIARYQPMAADLRFITTGMKINTELERIADLAVDIAQRVLQLADKPLLKPLIDIPALSLVAQTMVRDAINAFINKDVALAKKVLISDTEADTLRNRISDELINNYMTKDPDTAPRAVSLLLISRHLERICDHTTNIAEDVIYMVEGKVVRHHPEQLQ
ncbi:MAG: phosphate signaling complex protein PhoU [Candidatus Omnitrophica bacterium]|nr:phosphate signaling complex protein PhoU [Candidatus Omnitrophota bacterium]